MGTSGEGRLTQALLMRILYFSRDYTTHDRRFLLKLAESHHEILFLRLEDDGILYEKRALPRRIELVKWRGGQEPVKTPESCLRLMPDFESVLSEVRPDLVHAGPIQSCGFMTALVGFRPFMVMSWGSDILVDADRDDFLRWMTCYTLERSDMLFCDCKAVRNKVQKLVSYQDEKIVEFPWGIDLDQFSSSVDSSGFRKRMGWEDSFLILSTRSWEKIYNIESLLRAFRIAYTENPKLRLVLLGTGSLESAVGQYINDYGLDDVIYRPGIVSHGKMAEYFRAADLYMSCSRSDGTSISLLEAMASGLPVLVTNVGGNREWVNQGENGWLAPVGDVESFARGLLKASSMGFDDRKRIYSINRRVVEKRANWEKNFPRLLETYDQIQARHAK